MDIDFPNTASPKPNDNAATPPVNSFSFSFSFSLAAAEISEAGRCTSPSGALLPEGRDSGGVVLSVASRTLLFVSADSCFGGSGVVMVMVSDCDRNLAAAARKVRARAARPEEVPLVTTTFSGSVTTIFSSVAALVSFATSSILPEAKLIASSFAIAWFGTAASLRIASSVIVSIGIEWIVSVVSFCMSFCMSFCVSIEIGWIVSFVTTGSVAVSTIDANRCLLSSLAAAAATAAAANAAVSEVAAGRSLLSWLIAAAAAAASDAGCAAVMDEDSMFGMDVEAPTTESTSLDLFVGASMLGLSVVVAAVDIVDGSGAVADPFAMNSIAAGDSFEREAEVATNVSVVVGDEVEVEAVTNDSVAAADSFAVKDSVNAGDSCAMGGEAIGSWCIEVVEGMLGMLGGSTRVTGMSGCGCIFSVARDVVAESLIFFSWKGLNTSVQC